MATIDKSGIGTGNIVQAEHITRIIDALNESGSAEIIATGSFSGSFEGLFIGDGTNINGIVSSSHAVTASYALNADINPGIFSLTGSVHSTTNNIEITGSLTVIGDRLISGVTRTSKETVVVDNSIEINTHPSSSNIYPGSITLIDLRESLTNNIIFTLGSSAEYTHGERYEYIVTVVSNEDERFGISLSAGDEAIVKIFNMSATNLYSTTSIGIRSDPGEAMPGDRVVATYVGGNRWYIEAFVSGSYTI